MKNQPEINKYAISNEYNELLLKYDSLKEAYKKDITELRKANATYLESEEKYRLIFEYSPLGLLAFDENGIITACNDNLVKIIGSSKEKLIGINMLGLPDKKIVLAVKRAMKGKTGFYEDFYHSFTSSKITPVRVIFAPIKTDESLQFGGLGIIEDITERKKAENVLLESEKSIRLLLELAPDAFFQGDKNGDFIMTNKNATILTGYSKEELLKMNIKELFLHSGLIKSPLRYDLLNSGETIILEREIRRKDGVIRTIQMNSIKMPDNTYQTFMRDITENRKAQEELIVAKENAEESNRLKTAFLANMSHEIRTPMNGILGFADLLKEPKLDDVQQHEYIAMIEKSGVRMLNTINDIIDISKIESGEMKTFISETNINEQLDYIYTFFKPEVERKKLLLVKKSKLSNEHATINTDREKMYAILTNLIKNAIKFTDTGSIEFGYELKEKFLEFYVKDTGIGIPQNKQEDIFQRFIQADIGDQRAFQGAGLGLSITKAFIEMLGGTIWLKSKPGSGTVFYFTIPYNTELVVKNTIELSIAKNKQVPNIRNIKVLLAEDNEISEKLISLFLEKYNCELLNAGTGKKAVEICLNNPDLDLILMDIEMPELDGYNATKQIREFNKNVIIFAQTAFVLSGDEEKAIEAGCNEYLPKPINRNLFSALIEKYFSEEGK